MAEERSKSSAVPAGGAAGVTFTEAQKAEFRSSGLWMAVLGWVETLAGGLLGVAWLLSSRDIIPGQLLFPTPLERGTAGIQIGATLGIGVSTVWAASAFRRAPGDPGRTAEVVTEAVTRLRHLYEAQVILVGVIVGAIALSWLTGVGGR